MPVSATTVFCDDIRMEQTGKLILVGVYPADLVPAALPGTFPISMFVQLHGLSVGQHKFTLTLKAPSGAVVLEQSDEINHPDAQKPSVLVFGGVLMTIDALGEIIAEITIDGENYPAGHLAVSLPEPPKAADQN